MLYRIGYNLFIFISIVSLPWYSYALFILAGFFLFDRYIEGIMWGAWIDAVFAGSQTTVGSWFDLWNYYFFTTTAIIGFFATSRLKQSLSWYD